MTSQLRYAPGGENIGKNILAKNNNNDKSFVERLITKTSNSNKVTNFTAFQLSSINSVRNITMFCIETDLLPNRPKSYH